MQPHYFTEDGSFGSAEGLVVLDTENWSEDDWMEIEEAGDYLRLRTAQDIAQRYHNEGAH